MSCAFKKNKHKSIGRQDAFHGDGELLDPDAQCVVDRISNGGSRGASRRLCGHAVAAQEHALIDHLPENAQGPGLVQPTFVATDG